MGVSRRIILTGPVVAAAWLAVSVGLASSCGGKAAVDVPGGGTGGAVPEGCPGAGAPDLLTPCAPPGHECSVGMVSCPGLSPVEWVFRCSANGQWMLGYYDEHPCPESEYYVECEGLDFSPEATCPIRGMRCTVQELICSYPDDPTGYATYRYQCSYDGIWEQIGYDPPEC